MAHVTDARFQRLHTDPRFQRLPQKERKVQVDQRFAGMFHEKRFQTAAPVDRLGRKLPPRAGEGEEVRRLYELADEEPAEKKGKVKAKAKEREGRGKAKGKAKEGKAKAKVKGKKRREEEEEEEEEDDDGQGAADDWMARVAQRAGGGGDETESDSDDSAEGEGEAAEAESALVSWIEQRPGVVRVSESTRRLAVCECDWEQVRAVDLLAVLRSFVPAGGAVHRVAVYPSDFGEARMKEEAWRGPAIYGEAQRHERESDGEAEEDEAGAMERLRRYELDRLRYFYAVVECDSIRTADQLYNECDGAEFESSSLRLDLRYIPEDMEFHKTPRDEATELPPKYSAPSFMCSALQQSKVKLSWDADDNERVKLMRRDLSKSDVREMDYSAYLASSSDEAEEGEEEYHFDAAPPPPKKAAGGLGEMMRRMRSEEEVDQEVTFMPALEKRTDAKARARAEGGGELPPTVFELEQAKAKAKRKEKRARAAAATAEPEGDGLYDDEEEHPSPPSHTPPRLVSSPLPLPTSPCRPLLCTNSPSNETRYAQDDIPEELRDDPFFAEAIAERQAADNAARKKAGASKKGGDHEKAPLKKGSRKKRGREAEKEQTEEERKRQAELELLLMDGDDDARHFDTKDLLLRGGKKGKKGGRRDAEERAEDDHFQLDLADPRFSRIYDSTDFAIDPTDPKFKRTGATDVLLSEIQKRHERGETRAPAAAPPADSSLQRLVASVKSATKRSKAIAK
ncbi:hypothetical protein AB1Y20_014842 [Prymnesium parvum]|uniref:NUC153 domain-containing protein n=1 Tax=Prymnesium parvum TaxID=97485 RepID=A0AB34JVE6_PRYPA